ncbi:cytochrome c biogenesis CcdA family protein [Ilumatobacter sp.]|uniref:cytochrome c biogenesis CcdA family protein n=1 Tax=Ilumatobacter sp. TaxID=1967498 RepID=UPI003B52032D
MIDAPIGLAFAAGLVATVNPCGFAMLPAYLSYFMGLDGADDESARPGLGPALKVGAIVSASFLVVFATTGLLINAGVRSIIEWISYVALGVGVVMMILGVAMLRGFETNIGFLKAGHGASSRDTASIFTFGVSYALASLSCTLPVFLSVVVGSLASANFASGLATYIAYAAGMSTVLIALTIAVAMAKHRFVRRLRSALPYVHRISAGFLIVAGAYITWFWFDDLSSDAGEQSQAAGVVDRWSATLTNAIGNNSGLVGLTLGGIVVIAVLSSMLKRFKPDNDDTTNDDTTERTQSTSADRP